ncbi:MAG: class I SAM-dependent methyltransferase [Gammaproteobacteria bacterium]|nr:class I SAM-dependent methyltransferase [Gammaproteobacteria bacterium]
MATAEKKCRFCDGNLQFSFADLGMSPLANSYLKQENLHKMEAFYPLHAYVCESCFLVQLEEFETAEHIFSDYAYFSSYSKSWLAHAKAYTDDMIERFSIDSSWKVMEIASNDGYLLQYFKEQNIPVIGVEPAANVAKVAEKKGIPTAVEFLGVATAKKLLAQGHQSNLIAGNNVFAHVPDVNDFVGGLKILLAPEGVITIEFPHLMQMMEKNQFDTIYHEHFSYFSFVTAERVFKAHGLVLFDVQFLDTHGGSIRIFARHEENGDRVVQSSIPDLRKKEIDAGFESIETYRNFAEQVRETKRKLLEFLITEKRAGKTIVGYGAPAKGNTLLNYCGVRADFLDYTVDLSPHKAGLYLPGTHIPIFLPDKIAETKPDYVLILAWNLKDEIMEQMAHIRDWGGKFVVFIPEVQTY